MKKDFSSTQNAYLTEAAIQLRYAGFATSQIEASGLPVELDGQRLCTVTGSGGIRYQKSESWNTAMAGAFLRPRPRNGQLGFSIHSYFTDHPEMVLGELTTESTQYGREPFGTRLLLCRNIDKSFQVV